MKWNDSLSVQVKDIDEQHKQLIDIINKAYETALEKDKEKGNDILNELIEFTRVHFSTEEKYFEEFNYDDKEEHIQEHMDLTEKVLGFKNDYDKGKCDCKVFLGFLKKWVEDHLKVMDQKYVECFKEHGLR